jgi:nifR3 family TIM-barrel protein
MKKNFWKDLPRPILALAPMANVTDAAFRRVIAKYGKPDVMWTEFVSVEGLLSRGREKLLPDFWFTDAERPIVAQIFGSKPEQFREVAAQLAEMGFDGIDINMGCPDNGVEKSGGGASLINHPELAREIIEAVRAGAGGLPVSVKTRLGYSEVELDTWLAGLLSAKPDALTVHLRTRQEMSKVPAHWELMPSIKKLRDELAPDTALLGNGDVRSLEEARAKTAETGIDGVMIGRGIFGNPWCFADRTPTVPEKLAAMAEHTELFESLYKSDAEVRLKNFDVMKKHYQAYVAGFEGASALRTSLMQAKNAAEVRRLVEGFLAGNP